MNTKTISAKMIKNNLIADGATIVGIADISELKFSFGFKKSEFKKYTRAISIGVRLSDEIINGITDGPTNAYAEHYRTINYELDRITSKLENKLLSMNFRAFAIPASKRYDQKKLAAKFPHKTAAILSGLGWIGKSALLISFACGPRIRLATVLTNANIKADTPQRESNCGACSRCVENCPAEAITGKLWTFGDERSRLFDAHRCNKHLELKRKEVGETICGICIAVCPYGVLEEDK